MHIEECKEIAQECGLQTWSEALRNITMHSTMFFAYEKIDEEVNEMYREFSELHVKYTDSIND